VGKTFDIFDLRLGADGQQSHLMCASLSGDSWLDRAANLLVVSGPPGGGKTISGSLGLCARPITVRARAVHAHERSRFNACRSRRREPLPLTFALAKLDNYLG